MFLVFLARFDSSFPLLDVIYLFLKKFCASQHVPEEAAEVKLGLAVFWPFFGHEKRETWGNKGNLRVILRDQFLFFFNSGFNDLFLLLSRNV